MTDKKLRLFLFYDDIEEILVVAFDREDAFKVIEETYGKDAADELVLSKMGEYPMTQQMKMKNGSSEYVQTLLQTSTRGIAMRGNPGMLEKPEKK